MLPRDPEVAGALEGLAQHYEIEEECTRGATGYLFFARNRVDGRRVAIKFYEGLPGDERHDEPRRLAQLQAPNVLPILEARSISDTWGYFVTPRRSGDLNDFIATSPSCLVAVDVAIGICRGVAAIHAAGMLHRDLKAANIVIEGTDPEIADFGTVRLLPANVTEIPASQHTVIYRPPEAFDGGPYSARGDVYQIGLLTYQLLGGALGYEADDYLDASDREFAAGLIDDAERSLFEDSVIRIRAESGRMMQFGTLPPWIGGSTKAVLRRMAHPDPDRRTPSVTRAVADLTRIRASLQDWRRIPDGAELAQRRKRIVVELDGDAYQGYTVSNTKRRRIRGARGTFAEVLSNVGE